MVTRCVCFGQRFATLKKIARKNGARTFEELQRYVEFGHNCQRCRPYVNKMLATGETVFEVMKPDEAAAWEKPG